MFRPAAMETFHPHLPSPSDMTVLESYSQQQIHLMLFDQMKSFYERKSKLIYYDITKTLTLTTT